MVAFGLAGVARAAPGIDADAEAALDGARCRRRAAARASSTRSVRRPSQADSDRSPGARVKSAFLLKNSSGSIFSFGGEILEGGAGEEGSLLDGSARARRAAGRC